MIDGDLYCPQCGYNLRAIPENRCPECGFGYNREGIESLCVMEAHKRNVILHRVLMLSTVSACSALASLGGHPMKFALMLAVVVGIQILKRPPPPRAPRFFDAPLSWMIYLAILMLFVFPLFITRPASASLIALASALVAWCFVLWPAGQLDHHHLNLTPAVRGGIERYRAITFLWLFIASAAALLCLI